MIVAMPHCGMAANSTSGGEVVEREVLTHLAPTDIEAHIFRPSWRGLRWWNSPLWFARPLGECLRVHRPRLLRAHSLRYTGLAALNARRQTGIPVTAHFHHLERDHLSWLDRFVLRHADQVITDSEFSRRQAARVGITAKVVRLGVDHRRFVATPRHPLPMVLLIGGTKPRKNAAFVRRLWPEIVRQVPTAILADAGQGTGVSDAELPLWYQVARVVAFPSLLEGFGLPVLEAMACARPVVCSNRGALPEFGVPATPLDPRHWISRLVQLLTDDGLWAREAELNAVLAQEYSWERTVQAMAQAWRQCASA